MISDWISDFEELMDVIYMEKCPFEGNLPGPPCLAFASHRAGLVGPAPGWWIPLLPRGL